METYLIKFIRDLLKHRENLNEYVNERYDADSQTISALLGDMKSEGLINYSFADNRPYLVQLTLKGENISLSELKLSDKEELLILINSIDEIEGCFHKFQTPHKVYDQIYDVYEFQHWIQQVIYYLQEIYDRTRSHYIIETLNCCKQHMDGTNDKIQFNEIAAKLRSIEINIDRYYPNDIRKEAERKMGINEKTPKIFVSHSSKDEEHVKLIVKLLKEMGFGQDKVFCSSIPGYGIGLSQDIYEALRSLFEKHDLYVIFVHSPNYYDSAVSLNEMGAAWVLKSNFCSFLLPGFDYKDMKGVVDSKKIAIKIDSDKRMVQNLVNELYDDLTAFFSAKRDNSIVWETARDEFIDKMNALPVVLSGSISEDALNILKEADKDNLGKVVLARTIAGLIIEAGSTKMNTPGIRREEARMEEAVKELILKGYLTQNDKDFYQITDAGYKFLDNQGA